MSGGSRDSRPTVPAAADPAAATFEWVGTDFYSRFPSFAGLTEIEAFGWAALLGVVGMVEPVTTITAVTLLAAYLKGVAEEAGKQSGGGLGEGARAGLRKLYDVVKRRLSGDGFQQQTLERFEERPDDERRQRALDDVLSEAVEGDREFARELADLVAEVRRAAGDSIQITDSGAVAIGGNVIQRAGGDLAGRDLTKTDRAHERSTDDE